MQNTNLSTVPLSPLAIILSPPKSHHSNLSITPQKNAKNRRQAALGNDPVDAHHDLLRDVLILACSEILHNPPGLGQLGLHRDLRIHLAGLGQG